MALWLTRMFMSDRGTLRPVSQLLGEDNGCFLTSLQSSKQSSAGFQQVPGEGLIKSLISLSFYGAHVLPFLSISVTIIKV